MFRDGCKALSPRVVSHVTQLLAGFWQGKENRNIQGKEMLVIHAHSLMAFLGKDQLLRGLKIGVLHEKDIIKKIEP